MIGDRRERIQYAGDGVITAFGFPYMWLEDSEIAVILETAAGVETLQNITADYTLVGAGLGTGTVTMIVAPASGETLTIFRDTALDQNTDYTPNGSFPAETHEAALDKLTLICQELQRQIDLCIKYPKGEPGSGLIDRVLTKPNRFSKYLGFDGSGNMVLSPIDLDALTLLAPSTVDTADLVDDAVTWAKAMADDWFYCGVATGTNTYSATSGKSIPAYKDGMLISVQIQNTNTAPGATLNVDGLGAKTIVCSDNVAFPLGGLQTGKTAIFMYDAAENAFQLVSPLNIDHLSTAIWVKGDTGSDSALAFSTTGTNFTSTQRMFVGLAAATNTKGETTFDEGGAGAQPLTRPGGLPLLPGDVVINQDVHILKQTASIYQLLNPTNAIVKDTPSFRNLVFKPNAATPTTQLDIDADSIDLVGRTGNVANVVITHQASNFTIDATGTGQNGLDTGALANDTWYYAWVAWNKSTGTYYSLLSTSAAAGSVTWADATHDVFVRMVGTVRTNGSAQFESFHQQGNEVVILPTEIFNTKNNTSYTSIKSVTSTTDIEDIIPTHAIKCRGAFGVDAAGGGVSFTASIASTSAGLGEQVFINNDTNNGTHGGFDRSAWPYEIQIVETQDFYYKVTGTVNERITISGYTLSL